MDVLVKPGLEFYILFLLLLIGGIFLFKAGKRKQNLFVTYAGCGMLAGVILISLLLITYFIWFLNGK